MGTYDIQMYITNERICYHNLYMLFPLKRTGKKVPLSIAGEQSYSELLIKTYILPVKTV